MKYTGIVHRHLDDYIMPQRLHMVDFISAKGANLCIWNKLSWEESYDKVDTSDIRVLAERCNQKNVSLWIGMKPGDYRYCMHKEDRDLYVKNALNILKSGASGIYVVMDDTHPGGEARVKDAIYQAKLITELSDKIGTSLKAICGERYHTNEMLNHEYYEPILKVLPKNTLITWTGPKIWNRTLKGEDVIESDWPVLIWDNYFANDSFKPEKAPTYPFEGRDKKLLENIDAFVLNLNCHYPWQFGAIYTTLDFVKNPHSYVPEKSFQEVVRRLGGDSSDDFLKLGDEYWKRVEHKYKK